VRVITPHNGEPQNRHHTLVRSGEGPYHDSSALAEGVEIRSLVCRTASFIRSHAHTLVVSLVLSFVRTPFRWSVCSLPGICGYLFAHTRAILRRRKVFVHLLVRPFPFPLVASWFVCPIAHLSGRSFLLPLVSPLVSSLARLFVHSLGRPFARWIVRQAGAYD
jgi:hypothetical protein